MKTHLIICNEADYLQAHLTVIMSGSRRGNPALHGFKQWVSSVLKNWGLWRTCQQEERVVPGIGMGPHQRRDWVCADRG